MGDRNQIAYNSLARFIRAKYPNAVLDDHVTWYRGKVELDFYSHPRATEPFACVLVPGHDPVILKEF